MSSLERFTTPSRSWFEATFAAPTAAQTSGWDAIASGDHTLIHAPTGSGKTLAAFLWAIDRLSVEPPQPDRERCRVLYVSPMKALAYDVERNLRAPLAGVRLAAERLGAPTPEISVAMRTGDTPQNERQAMLRHPPDILITTPESLYLMLTSRAREILSTVRWVIIDEIHSIAGTKRGSHAALSLERLSEIADDPQRIGLSATQRPLETIAAFLGGGSPTDTGWQPRPVTIVDAPRVKEIDVEIVVPVEDMTRPDASAPPSDPDVDAAAPSAGAQRSIWPAVYPRLVDLLLDHRSTIFFVNSRGLAERLAAEMNRLTGDEIVQSHHGSVSREQRAEIEDRLKRGDLRGVVATSTLELGIDMAAVDLVVLVESPTSVASGLQRVGRASHQVGAASVAKVFPKHRADLLETAVVVERMYAGAIEETSVPANPLDVLAQQVVAITALDTRAVDEVFRLVRRAYPYRDLTRSAYEAVLDMLSGRYPSDEFAELRPRIVWDRVAGTIEGRRNARILAVTNPGTIPDRGLYRVTLPDGGRVGELDEEMVYESRPGDTFILGSSAWRIDEITLDRVVVTPSPGAAAKMPFWHGDTPGRPLEVGKAVGAFTRRIGALDQDAATAVLQDEYRLDPWAAANLAAFIADEHEATGALPTDRTLVVQRFRDEIGDWRVVVLSPFGGKVHAPWALAARRRFREQHGNDVDLIWSDDGMMFRFPDLDEAPGTSEILLEADEMEETLLAEVGDSALFAARFREAAARSLLLPRRRPGNRTPLWLQRRKAADLLEVTRKYGSFPVVLETYREILQDHFDLPALRSVLDDIEQRRTRVVEADVAQPSPFAGSLMFDFIASFMYEYDAPVAEKRAAALTLDRSLLAEILGEPEFRDLLEPAVLEEVAAELQALSEERRARSAEQVHDLLRGLGPLTGVEIQDRSAEPDVAAEWIEQLVEQRRVAEVRVQGTERFAAVEDVSRLRDALGVSPPQGIPEDLLAPVVDPVGDVVGRYARTHGPFAEDDAAAALGLPAAVVAEVLRRLEADGRVASGAYRPGHRGREWVDTGVLRRLRRRTLAVLRSEVEAVEPSALAAFLPQWQEVGRTRADVDGLAEAVRRLRGTAMPASILEADVLEMRAGGRARIDDLLASGEIVWIGRGPLGTRDGRVALYPRAQVPLLLWERDEPLPDAAAHEVIRTHLAERGASFFNDLYAACGGGDPGDTLAAIWDLVWSGEVTNDTLAPLRAFTTTRSRRRTSRRRPAPSTAPPAGTGRWYLVADLLLESVSAEEQATARAEMFLDRHGIVTRPAVLGEGLPGGFAGLYPVLIAMEDAGRVRRGYFIEGLGGAQFGIPGAIGRLRSEPGSGIVVLAAADPANAYGGTVAWPEHPTARPARRSGAYVVLDRGALIVYSERGGKRALAFGDDTAAFAAGLAAVARHRGQMTIETIDGEPVAGSRWDADVTEAGFRSGYRGYTLRA